MRLLVRQEDGKEVKVAKIALVKALLSILDVAIDLAVDNLRVGAHLLEKLTHLKFLVEEHEDQSSDRMLHPFNIRSLRLDCHVVDSLTQTALFGCEGVCQ